MTLLPKQLRRLADEAEKTNGAVRIAQDGSTVYADTGEDKFVLNARGENITNPDQERLC